MRLSYRQLFFFIEVLTYRMLLFLYIRTVLKIKCFLINILTAQFDNLKISIRKNYLENYEPYSSLEIIDRQPNNLSKEINVWYNA